MFKNTCLCLEGWHKFVSRRWSSICAWLYKYLWFWLFCKSMFLLVTLFCVLFSDRTLLEVVNEILPVCVNYNAVVRFMEGERVSYEITFMLAIIWHTCKKNNYNSINWNLMNRNWKLDNGSISFMKSQGISMILLISYLSYYWFIICSVLSVRTSWFQSFHLF